MGRLALLGHRLSGWRSRRRHHGVGATPPSNIAPKVLNRTSTQRAALRRARLLAVLGGLLLAVMAVGVGYPVWWTHRAATVGHQLLGQTQVTAPAAAYAHHTLTYCAGAASSSSLAARRHPTVLEIPAIGLVAPVLQGIGETVLAVAVGHDPSTSWPNAKGESLLLAHDVSYFSGLNHVKNGDQVIWIDGCQEYVFRVVGHEVTRPGAAVPVPPGGKGLGLLTCWPTDALFWTPDRYIVETVFVRQRRIAAPVIPSSGPLDLRVPAPPALAAEGLSLGRSGVLAGRLSLTGSPSPTFSNGPSPLEAADRALEDYAAAQKAAQAKNRSWWTALALPGVPLPAPWSLVYATNVVLSVQGSIVEGAVLSSPAGTLTLIVRRGTFYVSSATPSQ